MLPKTIHYYPLTTDIGKALVARHGTKVCFLQFADDIPTLIEALKCAFPRHCFKKEATGASLEQMIHRLVNGKQVGTSPGLHQKGTVFQRKVWREIQSIPSGEVRTYAELADMVGQPNAVRAVASACAKNSIALLIPCHRVVRSDGTLGGYRWGVRRKEALLNAEATRSRKSS